MPNYHVPNKLSVFERYEKISISSALCYVDTAFLNLSLSAICLQDTGRQTGFYSRSRNLDRFLLTRFCLRLILDRKAEQDKNMENRISVRFLDRTGKTLFCWITCDRTCFCNPFLPSCLNNGRAVFSHERNLSRFRA